MIQFLDRNVTKYLNADLILKTLVWVTVIGMNLHVFGLVGPFFFLGAHSVILALILVLVHRIRAAVSVNTEAAAVLLIRAVDDAKQDSSTTPIT